MDGSVFFAISFSVGATPDLSTSPNEERPRCCISLYVSNECSIRTSSFDLSASSFSVNCPSRPEIGESNRLPPKGHLLKI